MATRIETQLIDDLDGSEAAETVRFSIDGTNYEIDLSRENAEQMREVLAEFTGAARKVTGRRTAPARPKPRQRTAEIRSWARERGYPVNSRGAIRANIIEAYEQAS